MAEKKCNRCNTHKCLQSFSPDIRRKLGLLPSVTSIIKCAASPGLELWKNQQILMAALTTDRIENESEQEWVDRIIKDSQEQALRARERGTLIHSYVQDWFEGNEIEQGLDGYPFAMSAHDTIFNEVKNQEWVCEKSFSTEKYGGKADLHNINFLIDIKTTDKPVEDLKLWDDHYLQLAAYRAGLGIITATCGILYINSRTAASRLVWAGEKELVKGMKMFNALLDYYYSKTGLGE
ncbi:MAG: hypothetical protein WC373_14490 [Smithella sp.]|jgi:hypothetical protein